MPVRQLQGKQHCIRLGTFKRGLRRRRTLGRNDFVTLRLEQRVHQITHVRVVVHHHDSRFHTGRFRLGSHARVKPRNSSKKTSCVSNNRSGRNCTATTHGNTPVAASANSSAST